MCYLVESSVRHGTHWCDNFGFYSCNDTIPKLGGIFPWNTVQMTTLVLFCVWFGIPVFITIILVLCGLVAFTALVMWYSLVQTSSVMLPRKIPYYSFIGMSGHVMLDYFQWNWDSLLLVIILVSTVFLCDVSITIVSNNPLHTMVQASLVFERFRIQKSL